MQMSVATNILWMTVLGCSMIALAETTCLPDAVEASQRKNITIKGVSMPLGVFKYTWPSGDLLGEAYKILAEEMLGYNTVISVASSVVKQAFLEVGNCADVEIGEGEVEMQCNTEEPPRSHVALETWSSWHHMKDLVAAKVKPEDAPLFLGSVGYPGTENQYALSPTTAPADQVGLALEFYRNYNASMYNVSSYFSKVTDIPKSDLRPCEDTYIHQDLENLGTYFKWSNDTDGLEWKDGKIFKAKCWDEVWWLSPACRTHRSACIPLITGGKGWGLFSFMAQVAAANVPVAMGVAANWGLYLSLPVDYKVLLYWWMPDASFIHLNPQKILYPEYNELEWAEGNKRSNAKNILLAKLVGGQLKHVARRAYELANGLSFSAVSISLIMKDQKLSGESSKEAMCKWLQSNEATWKKWIPIETACVEGQGLVDAEGQYVLKRDLKGACEWCKPGEMSSSIRDDVGQTYVCSPCPAGQHQPAPGQKQCDACPPGFYQSDAGSASCDPCPLGKFRSANAVNGSVCQNCPEGTSTSAPGNAQADSCRCIAGTFMPAAGSQCLRCPDGMECAFGSLEANIFKDTSGLLQNKDAETYLKAYPKVLPGFYSKVERPLFVYECEPVGACSGGRPASCAGLREGFMCSACPSSYILSDDVEEDPKADGCNECQFSMVVYIGFGCVFGVGLLFAQLYLAKDSPLLDGPVKVEIQSVAGQGLMFLQVLGAIQSVNLDFGRPFTEVLTGATDVVSIAAAFAGIPCVSHGMNSTVALFALQITLPVLFGVIMITAFYIVNCIRKGSLMRDALLNCFGEILIEFYVSITVAVLRPFNCYPHPAEKSSMFSSPEILCWEGDHNVMVALSIIGFLLYTVNSIIITYFATWVHPRAMAKNDIGILVRCHFLFNRWRPQSYWFSTVSITRNCLIAFLPMVIPKKDLAVMFMTFTLVIPSLLMAENKPRRTGAMNALDLHICFTQIMILAVGSMSIYTGGLDSAGLSWVLLLLTTTVVLVGLFILTIKGLQYVTKNRSPLSWAFDVCLDHHGGAGASASRTLYMVLSSSIRRHKLFYDLDHYLTKGTLPVILDAAKLSQHFVAVLGNETWCRSWCTGAACSVVQRKIPISTISFGVNSQDFDGCMSTHESLNNTKTAAAEFGKRLSQTSPEEFLKMIAKQVPFEDLRPMGVSDDHVPGAIEQVLSVRPNLFAMDVQASVEAFFKALFEEMPDVPVDRDSQSSPKTPSILSKLFSESKMQGEDCIVISCDHSDPDGVGVSRLFYLFIQNFLAGSEPGMAPLRKYRIIQDVDLTAVDFANLVQAGKVHAMMSIFTSHTLKSTVQLLRLGFMYENSTTQFRSYPVVISDVFSSPGARLLDRIQSGAGLDLGEVPEETSKYYTTAVVSLKNVKCALWDVLDRHITLCNVPAMTVPEVNRRLKIVLSDIAREIQLPREARQPQGPSTSTVPRPIQPEEFLQECECAV